MLRHCTGYVPILLYFPAKVSYFAAAGFPAAILLFKSPFDWIIT